VAIHIDLGWAALSTLIVALIGGWYTVHNYGLWLLQPRSAPIGKRRSCNSTRCSDVYALFNLSRVWNLRKTQSELRQIAALHKLVVDNSRDAIELGDLDGRRTYVSPGIRALTGWNPEDLGWTRLP